MIRRKDRAGNQAFDEAYCEQNRQARKTQGRGGHSVTSEEENGSKQAADEPGADDKQHPSGGPELAPIHGHDGAA